MTERILIFDFDGVISNSIQDSFLTALKTYIELISYHTLPWNEDINLKNFTFKFEKERLNVFNTYSRLMPFGNRAEDYFVIFKIIDEKVTLDINNQSDFDEYKDLIPSNVLLEYHKLFYRIRSSFRESNYNEWIKLRTPFQGVFNALKTLSKRFILAIASSQDKFSITLHLKSYNLSSYFKDEYILGKDFSESKQDYLIRFHEMTQIPFSNFHFIDDKVSHLLDVKDLGIQGYLALWGFNTPREHQIAESNGFTLLDLKDLPHLDSEIK